MSDTSVKIYPFLAKLKIPFFVIIVVLIAVDLGISFLSHYLELSTGPLALFYIAISIAFVIFYFVTAGKSSTD